MTSEKDIQKLLNKCFIRNKDQFESDNYTCKMCNEKHRPQNLYGADSNGTPITLCKKDALRILLKDIHKHHKPEIYNDAMERAGKPELKVPIDDRGKGIIWDKEGSYQEYKEQQATTDTEDSVDESEDQDKKSAYETIGRFTVAILYIPLWFTVQFLWLCLLPFRVIWSLSTDITGALESANKTEESDKSTSEKELVDIDIK